LYANLQPNPQTYYLTRQPVEMAGKNYQEHRAALHFLRIVFPEATQAQLRRIWLQHDRKLHPTFKSLKETYKANEIKSDILRIIMKKSSLTLYEVSEMSLSPQLEHNSTLFT